VRGGRRGGRLFAGTGHGYQPGADEHGPAFGYADGDVALPHAGAYYCDHALAVDLGPFADHFGVQLPRVTAGSDRTFRRHPVPRKRT
jgi:hypothetical protein